MAELAAAAAPTARVLVVDDNEDNRDLLQRRLERSGFEVVTAEDGRRALAAIASESFDAVLLDVMMPGMSGNEVLLELRARYTKTELPVIMATAKSDSDDIVAALDQGANDYVTKPINFKVLVARLTSHLATKQEAQDRAGPVIDVSLGIEHGTVLDERYEILEMAGEGGFAQVYRARQLSTGQMVAFKHARPERVRRSTATSELQRFEREMKLIAKLRHPHIVRLIDSGSIAVRRGQLSQSRSESQRTDEATRQEPAPARGDDSGTRPRTTSVAPDTENDVLSVPYMVMEYLEGESLNDLIKREGRIPHREALALMLPVMSALRAAHDEGIIHRDVKPQNVLLVKDHKGDIQPKVLDFGIAKLTDPDAEALTVNESFIGTPEYSAPEQARGKKNIDARADQFSVAAILYRLLSGKPMYQADSFMGMVSAVVHGEFAPLREVVPSGVPAGVVRAIDKALSTKREDRFADLDELARALLPFVDETVTRRWMDHFDANPDSISDSSQDAIPIRISTAGLDPDAPTLDETGSTLEVTFDRAPTVRPPSAAAAPERRNTWITAIVIAAIALAVFLLTR